MKTVLKTLALLILIGTSLLSCIKDNHQELIQEEKQRLRQYVISMNYDVEPTNSGLYYIELEKGTGVAPKPGDFILANYTGSLLEGERIFGTTDYDIAIENDIYYENFLYGPFLLEYGIINPTGVNEGLSFMNEGGKSRILFPSTLGYGRQAIGDIPAYSSLIYDIELLKVISDPVQYQTDMVEEYLTESKIQASPNAEGLYYIEHMEGIGPTPDISNLVDVSYNAYLMDGRLIASTLETKTYSMQSYTQVYFSEHYTNKGLRDAIMKMRAGGVATVIVPYNLAFGMNSVDASSLGYKVPIPPYSTLRYEIELKAIK